MKSYLTFVFLLATLQSSFSQSTTELIENAQVTSSKVVKLGQSRSIRSLKERKLTADFKKRNNRNFKKAPENFKGRRGFSKSIHKSIEHQGPDPLRQTRFSPNGQKVEPFVNVNGIGDFGSPHDPTGDVSDQYYVQMVNATMIGVFDLNGNLISKFSANTLWMEFDQSSVGDPIVLYDEQADRWILTEFSDPANVLIAISDSDDPLGTYTAYNFSTPNFPDYPKYALSLDILILTTNEEGPGELHQYFIDLHGLYRGDEEVNMQRVRIPGSIGIEGGFYVSSPVDWNGFSPPFDNKPITIAMNDSSWDGGPANDQIDVYSFNVDFLNDINTTVLRTSIVTTPFDPFPCSESGFGFACIPQFEGEGLDAIPEVIMNLPHLRNFGSHESMVFSFVTDVTNGDNLSGIRWMELRRYAAEDPWKLHQEGTFAPTDGYDRFMPSIAMDQNGNIGLAYNISSAESYVGARFTGRTRNDPPGEMTIEEVTIVDGVNTINSGERFGDYSHMSVAPGNDNAFWWTSEYAGEGTFVSQTRIVAFRINRDSFDLSLSAINNPVTGSALTTEEEVEVSVTNTGLKRMSNYKVDLIFQGKIIETLSVDDPLFPDSTRKIIFESLLDLSSVAQYEIGAVVSSVLDQNSLNDTIRSSIRQLHAIEAGISGGIEQGSCKSTSEANLVIVNNGAETIDSLIIKIDIDAKTVDSILYRGALSFGQSVILEHQVEDLSPGRNKIDFYISSVNGGQQDTLSFNDTLSLIVSKLAEDQFITLEFRADPFPFENQWELYYESTSELIASGDFEDVVSQMTVRETICVDPDSCFRFVMTDAFGDGICCDFGNGSFSIFDNQDALLVSNNGQFGASATEIFCGRAIGCTLDVDITSSPASAENSADGIISIEVAGGIEPYSYSLDSGETFQQSAIFMNLLPGTYDLSVKDQSGSCQFNEMVLVESSSAVYDFLGNPVDVQIAPNPTSDVFKIKVDGSQFRPSQMDVEIVSLSGQVLQSRKINRYDGAYVGTFSLMAFAPGPYLVKISNNQVNHIERVIKLVD
ncbi:T9SS type A sorting domain-containing protein [Portibacter marinus]|uniref:T9SS type A sorting domain-containing protein n=1 Tax=Portibacter marinus TaxID=2898660 RepID=UPI001F3AE2CB|nr:T9SS type A sorting domain-containing protein [Portibacter marinus]